MEEQDNLEVCNSPHPNRPEITCIRFGKCLVDHHLGIVKHRNGDWELVEWGKFVEAEVEEFGGFGHYRILTIS